MMTKLKLISRYRAKANYLGWEILKNHRFGRGKRLAFSASRWESSFRRYERFFSHQFDFIDFASLDTLARYDHVIPLSQQATELLHDRFGSDERAVVPSPKAFQLLNDKQLFFTLLQEGPFSYLSPTAQGQSLPWIIKPKMGANSEKCFIVRDYLEIAMHADKIASVDWVVQQYIRGTVEFATHILMKRGEIRKFLCIAYKFSHEMPIKTLDRPIEKRLVSDRYLATWGKLLASLDYEGMCCVNYKVESNTPKLLEINPRLGGSVSKYFFGFVPSL